MSTAPPLPLPRGRCGHSDCSDLHCGAPHASADERAAPRTRRRRCCWRPTSRPRWRGPPTRTRPTRAAASSTSPSASARSSSTDGRHSRAPPLGAAQPSGAVACASVGRPPRPVASARAAVRARAAHPRANVGIRGVRHGADSARPRAIDCLDSTAVRALAWIACVAPSRSRHAECSRAAATHSTQRAQQTWRKAAPTPPAARDPRGRPSPIGACGTERAGWAGWLWAGGADTSRGPRGGGG
jgi:hypothetical protein